MTPIVIEAARADDIGPLGEMIENCYRGDHARMGWTHEADLLSDRRLGDGELAALFADPDVAIFVARQGSDVVGCVAVTDRPPDAAYVGLLCVDPPFQSSGLGGRLLATAERMGAALGVALLEMTVIEDRAELIAWYCRHGWADTGTRSSFPGDADLQFVHLRKAI